MSVLELTADAYHADQIDDRPSLSASIAAILCNASPAHARAAHPKLNDAFKRQEEPHFDIGTVAHALLLEGRNSIMVVNANDWRTKDAREQRDAARLAGRIPLLEKHSYEVLDMVAAVREQLAAHKAEPPLFQDGKAEQTLVWDDAGVLCRARLDWLRDDLRAVDDLKTTGRSANPEAYSRALFSVGGDVQAAFYLRGLRAVTGAEPEWRWVVVETSPPYALSVISPGPDVLALGESKVKYALEVWKRCLDTGVWPGYEPRVATAELPPWEDARWLDKTQREGIAA
jgi:hypothetical protein